MMATSRPARWARTGRAQVAALLLAVAAALDPAAAQEAPTAEDAAPPAAAEPAWIHGEVRTNFRATPSASATPLGVVQTGDAVQVVERRGDWARIETAEGASGWLPGSYLTTEAPPFERIAALEAQLAALEEELGAARRETEAERGRVDEIASRDAEREEAMRRLTEENRDLRAGERWPYLVTGAAILGIGIAVGRLLMPGSSRRSSSRIRF